MLSRYASLLLRRLLKTDAWFTFENDISTSPSLKSSTAYFCAPLWIIFQENKSSHICSYHVNRKLRESLKSTILCIKLSNARNKELLLNFPRVRSTKLVAWWSHRNLPLKMNGFAPLLASTTEFSWSFSPSTLPGGVFRALQTVESS